MGKNLLDYTGLTVFTQKIETFILDKVANLVPKTRTINGKTLSSDITLTAEDIGVSEPDLSGYVPTTRTVNGKPLSSDVTLSAEDVNAKPSTWSPDLSGYVPTTRTVNGKPLSSDVTLSAEDVNAKPSTWSPDLSGYVPTTRTVNGKPLSSDVTLTAEDIGVSEPDLSGYVPTTRTVNGKPLSSDVTLSAEDVNAKPSTWSPDLSGYVPSTRTVNGKPLSSDVTLTAEDIGIDGVDLSGYVPSTRTVNGKPLTSDVTLSASDVNALPTDGTAVSATKLATARTIRTNLSSTSTASFNGTDNVTPGVTGTLGVAHGGTGVTSLGALKEALDIETPDLSAYAPKASPVFTGTISRYRKSGSSSGLRSISLGYNSVASGTDSFAEGEDTVASGNYSHAEGLDTTAEGNHSHAEGHLTKALTDSAHAEGYQTTASSAGDHSEGNDTKASGGFSHAEGSGTEASAISSHAEGMNSKASGIGSHAEGFNTVVSSTFAHVEGYNSIASGTSSHAEGGTTIASGNASHAEGTHTTASNHSSHACGKYNKTMINGGDVNNSVGDVFVVGNGTANLDGSNASLSNAFRIAYNGTIYATSQYMSTGADYAEYFEWLDGNPNAEDRVGHFVTLEGDKIKLAQEGDYILGVISGQPCVIGNADEDWLGRWEHDDFNRFVKEYLTHAEVEVFPPDDVTNATNPDEALQLWLIQNNVETRDGHYFKMETEVVDYPTASWRHKANPSYDPTQPYIERKDRQEWDAVGMVGVLSVIDDGTCVVNGYAKVTQNGVATKADTLEYAKSWRVIERVSYDVVKIVFSV